MEPKLDLFFFFGAWWILQCNCWSSNWGVNYMECKHLTSVVCLQTSNLKKKKFLLLSTSRFAPGSLLVIPLGTN